jgi:hypothetical protein
MTHAFLQQRLLRFLWCYEALVIFITFAGGIYLATSGGGSIMLAIPLLLTSCAEAIRIPLAGLSTRVGFQSRMLALFALFVISVISCDGLLLVFEATISNRTAAITKQQRVVDLAQDALSSRQNERNTAQAALDNAKGKLAAIDADILSKQQNPPQQPALTGALCGKSRSVCPIDRQARAEFAKAQGEHLGTLKDLRRQRQVAQAEVDHAVGSVNNIDLHPTEVALVAAQHDLEDLKLNSPLHRFVSSILAVKVTELSDESFESVTRIGVVTLAVAFATLSSVAALIAHAPERGKDEARLMRSLRAYVARKRKVLTFPKPVRTEVKERVRYVYVPIHSADKDSLLKNGMTGEGLKAYKDLFQ